jgi:hypothetical protein
MLMTAGSGSPASARGTTEIKFLGKKYNLLEDFPAGHFIRGSGAAVTVGTYYTYRAYGAVSKPRLTVQRKVGGHKWKTLKKAKVKIGAKRKVMAKVPAYTVPASKPSQVVKYRFVSTPTRTSKGRVVNTARSAPMVVTYDNPAHYVGLAATFYSAFAGYCPTTAVRVVEGLREKGASARHSPPWGVQVDSREAADDAVTITGIALHECAHYKQFANFGSTRKGYRKSHKVSDTIFVNDLNPAGGTPPAVVPFESWEHAADCASQVTNPLGFPPSGYGGYCNPDELAAATRLMQGGKY